MKCPHCTISFHESWGSWFDGGTDADHSRFRVDTTVCPACKKAVIRLLRYSKAGFSVSESFAYPVGRSRFLAPEVPNPYAADFREASDVLSISPKASAALSRGNLQAVLRDRHKVKHGNLSKEIEEFIAQPGTPSTLKDVVDAVRNIGNFAAHPTKDSVTGSLVTVEPHEAEWLLDVLEELFDFTFVQPARNKAKVANLNAKLQSVGKPPMK